MPAAISCIYISYALSVRNLRLFSFYSFAITENRLTSPSHGPHLWCPGDYCSHISGLRLFPGRLRAGCGVPIPPLYLVHQLNQHYLATGKDRDTRIRPGSCGGMVGGYPRGTMTRANET